MSSSTRRRSVKDFQFGSKIGEGSYSTVFKAVDVHSRKVFAVKILSKSHIVKEKKIKYVNIEKQTLNRLGHHPGVVTLYYTFQDEASLFFVIDFAEYGELLTLIRKLGSLNEVSTRYYMIQLVDAIKFMHSKGVIHRDLKPENILLNHDMKLMVTDFGAAKMLDEDGNVEEPKNNLPLNADGAEERAASFVGTAEYVSPELLQHNECGYESDIWAVGCILYQFIVGIPPFKASTEYLTFEKIIALEYKFPNYYIPDSVKHLIKNILVLDPKTRYRISDIQAHLFFKNVPWTDFNYIWKRNPPKIEAYDPRIYQQKPTVLENPSKLVHKQFKKPIAASSKTLDIINSTYVPSSNHIMAGGSPKKAFPTPAKGYPKIAPFTRPQAASTPITGMGIRSEKPSPPTYLTSLTPQQFPLQTSSQNSSPVHLQQYNHEKQNSNASGSSTRQPVPFYSKPKTYQSQPGSPSTLDIQKPVLMDQTQIMQKQLQLKKMENQKAQDKYLLEAHKNQDKYSLPEPEKDTEIFSPLDRIGAGFLDDLEANKDPIVAASEAIQSAQKFRAKNLFVSTNLNLSSDNLVDPAYSPKSHPKSDVFKADTPPRNSNTKHPYAAMRIANNYEKGVGASSNYDKVGNNNYEKSTSNPNTPTDIKFAPQNRFSPATSNFTHFDTSPNNNNVPRTQSSTLSTLAQAKLPQWMEPSKSLTINATNGINNLVSPTFPFSKNKTHSLTNDKLPASVSPVIYFDEDIAPGYVSGDIPDEITKTLLPDEQIIKLDTIVVSELTFEDILVTNPDLLIDTTFGSKLNLTDTSINEIISTNAKIIDYYSKPEVMYITTTGRLFILQSIALDNKLFEITLTDNKISLYDYEFDESAFNGYLLLELIDRKSLLFLSPHDHKKVTIDFEVNTAITWIECLFKAKQLLKPRQKSGDSVKSNRSVSAPLVPTTAAIPPASIGNSHGATPLGSPTRARKMASSSNLRIKSPTNGNLKVAETIKNGFRAASASAGNSTKSTKNGTAFHSNTTAAAAAAAAAINKDYR